MEGEPENLKIEENCNCAGCDLEMTQEEVFFKEGLVEMSRGTNDEKVMKDWCKKCVEGSELLTHKSNDMIRHFVYLILRDTDKATREVMREEIKATRSDDYELVKDMFDIESFYEIVEDKEERKD